MARRTRALIAEMFADVREQLRALPWKDLQPVEVRQMQEVGDAAPLDGGDPFVTQAALLFDRLMGQWLSIFDREAAQVGRGCQYLSGHRRGVDQGEFRLVGELPAPD